MGSHHLPTGRPWEMRGVEHTFLAKEEEGQCAAVLFMSVSRILHKLSLYHMAKEENYKSDRSGIFKK